MDQLHMTRTQATPSLNPSYYAQVHGGVLYNTACTTNVVVYLYVLCMPLMVLICVLCMTLMVFIYVYY
jgi:hypothetical protein